MCVVLWLNDWLIFVFGNVISQPVFSNFTPCTAQYKYDPYSEVPFWVGFVTVCGPWNSWMHTSHDLMTESMAVHWKSVPQAQCLKRDDTSLPCIKTYCWLDVGEGRGEGRDPPSSYPFAQVNWGAPGQTDYPARLLFFLPTPSLASGSWSRSVNLWFVLKVSQLGELWMGVCS